MASVEVHVRDQIVAFKRTLAPQRETLKRAYADVKNEINRAVDGIVRDVAAGRSVVPEVEYRNIREGTVPEGVRRAIRSSGCVVIRGVFPASLASDWFAEVSEYLAINRYEEREVEKRNLDKYFSALKAGRPQIFNVYWSRPQVMARQDPRLLRGGGKYVDDITLPGMAFGHVLRSPYAHAKIKSIDTSKAKAAPGVLAVLTGDDWIKSGWGDLPVPVTHKRRDGSPNYKPRYPALVKDRVRFVGDYVAFVVAETKNQARDGTWRPLAVRVPGRRVEVRARTGYLAGARVAAVPPRADLH